MLYANYYNECSYFLQSEDKVADLRQYRGRRKMSSQTDTRGAGRTHRWILDRGCWDSGGKSPDRDRFCQRDGDLKPALQHIAIPLPRPGLSFASPPKGLASNFFSICVQLAYLKLSSAGRDRPSS